VPSFAVTITLADQHPPRRSFLIFSACTSIAFLILVSESASPVAVNVDLADHPIIDPNRNNDLGSRFERTRQFRFQV
jgi:hypothetical protein